MEDSIKKLVREGYAKIASEGAAGCAPVKSCCGSADKAETISREVGYTDDDLGAVPEGANLGLGCGNPVAMASLKEGDAVLDLGSGAGIDCFLAARRVGATGRVIGVDMTPEMLDRARENAKKGDYNNVEFRLGEIEHLPVADRSVDVVISNCVINLAPNKGQVFSEAFRVLKPGGRLMVSDIVLLKELPDAIKSSVEAYIGCLSGAIMKDDYLAAIRTAGFSGVEVVDASSFPVELMANDPTAQAIIENLAIPAGQMTDIANTVASIKVRAIKPV